VLEELSKRVEARLKPRWGENIPWDKIFELILMFVERCFPEPTAAVEAAKSHHGVMELAAMNVMIRSVLGIWRRSAILDVRAALLEELVATSSDDLLTCHAEACKVLGYARA